MGNMNTLALNGARSQDPTEAFHARAPRTRTCLNGKLVFGDGAYSRDCAIRDLSNGGAKVTVQQQEALPHELHLIIVRTCVAHEARIVWMNYPARGLQFCKTYNLSGDLPDELKFLRKLWGDLYARAGWDTMM